MNGTEKDAIVYTVLGLTALFAIGFGVNSLFVSRKEWDVFKKEWDDFRKIILDRLR